MGEKMKDRRYKKTEERILTVFFDERFETMREIAKRAGVARSTIYTHHHKAVEILPDWEAYILAEYQLSIKRKIETRSVKSLYLETLVFILKNRKFFEVFLKFDDREIIIKMIFMIWNVEKSNKVLRIIASGVVEIIFDWAERGFSKKELEKVLSEIMYLSETIKGKLDPLCDWEQKNCARWKRSF